jgi:aminoglycoside 6'-N-acetyltransferase I
MGVSGRVRLLASGEESEWLRMRHALWPDSKDEFLQKEMREILSDPQQQVFILERPGGSLGGFIEASLRPWADGCETSPVGYIEGWYIDSDLRRQGAGAALVQAAEAWAVSQGCREMASDCELWNEVSYKAHLALGYEETLRIIQFRKLLST